MIVRFLLAGAVLASAACAPSTVRSGPTTAVAVNGPRAPTPGMQYLYGSGEAAAISVQAWRALVDYVGAAIRTRPAQGVVLTAAATLERPVFTSCGAKPLAAVFDVDETMLLNLGFEADDAAHPGRGYDPARWRRWEETGARDVLPTPGAVEALAALRRMGVTIVFNTNRSAATAAGTEAALNGAGLGSARHGDTLYLSGDDSSGSHKDGRRAMIAARFCVVAMGGDQLGDFSDLFDAAMAPASRRAATVSGPIAQMWGAGWFVLPNPVYGAGLKGGVDDVFPADKRWVDPASGG